MKKPYTVTLPIDIDGRIYNYGDIVSLELEVAVQYSHALIALGEGEEDNGRNQ